MLNNNIHKNQQITATKNLLFCKNRVITIYIDTNIDSLIMLIKTGENVIEFVLIDNLNFEVVMYVTKPFEVYICIERKRLKPC